MQIKVVIMCVAIYGIANADEIKPQLLQGSESPVISSPTKAGYCYVFADSTIITKSISGNVGEQVQIKPTSDRKCKWDNSGSSWTINNDASYFWGKWKSFIFLDQGTGPDMRQLLIFDMRSRSQQFVDSYALPIQITGSNIQYWQAIPTIATKKNCDKFVQAVKTGLTPQIQQHISVNLSNTAFATKVLADKRCSLTQ